MADAKTEKQKVKEITDKLEKGLKELFESEKYKSYLSTMSKFHNYSFNNTLLIAMERALPYLEDTDMVELSVRVIGKLQDMTDEEFKRLELTEGL